MALSIWTQTSFYLLIGRINDNQKSVSLKRQRTTTWILPERAAIAVGNTSFMGGKMLSNSSTHKGLWEEYKTPEGFKWKDPLLV